MARMRVEMVTVDCPMCGGKHEIPRRQMLVKRDKLWIGYVMNMWCDERGQQIVKLYDEQYHYVCWQQNLWEHIYDYEDIPF